MLQIRVFCLCLLFGDGLTLLYPRDSPTRESKSLDGIWQFKLSPKMDPDIGFRDKWFQQPLNLADGEILDMPVPSSYNDITTNSSIRDYVGWVWYSRSFYVPLSWSQQNVWLRFGSVHYTAMVYINGEYVGSHSGGHLPFQFSINNFTNFSQENWLTVAVNNTLNRYTVPQGDYKWENSSNKYPAGYSTLEYNFDFFNYAGIHRPVILHTTPKEIQITDITTSTSVDDKHTLATLTVAVDFEVVEGDNDDVKCELTLFDKLGQHVVGTATDCHASIQIPNPNLWWPYLSLAAGSSFIVGSESSSPTAGYLHNLKVNIFSAKNGQDEYKLPIGLREITWGNSTFHINHQPFYFRGFGRHEDSDIRGKGLDLPLVIRDYNLIKWIGANSYRTSHYPYADEIMDLADSNGIAIIDECPAVALDHFEDGLLKNHLKSISELIQRDKNHASVVMWSVGNEPKSYRSTAGDYFKKVADYTRSMDKTRPVTLVVNVDYTKDQASQHFDVIAVNRYFGWYSDPGHIELIQSQMLADLKGWRAARGKPVMISEYGADTLAGIHSLPYNQFTEEYQTALMKENFKAFDEARREGWFIGEMIWNFADFMTKQQVTRVDGNKKGIFTRDRKPKLSAHLLRWRYWKLAGHGIEDIFF